MTRPILEYTMFQFRGMHVHMLDFTMLTLHCKMHLEIVKSPLPNTSNDLFVL